ncbi:4-hydroxy-2-oxoheptanedioate aldolase [Aidingimonas halophila]|uniref:2,4-dihydroxyhept-2-enedioate aldolase n=1 Tax=Aidingimonas halophila TaxID=574349 RepID=A0A1H2SNG3_9GAMM|nr:4-hydroxy-2-oxoheptanedioate aldolase [Aidingimonas halophila]SDW33142.1 2,4-dihydroxyhept-2-enedioate aldolase [Aidingimonas halophila]
MKGSRITGLEPGNTFKEALAYRQPQIGFWLSMGSSYCAEMCATASFDWLLIDGEHAPNDINSTLAQLQVVSAYRSHPVVRAVQGEPALIKQLLDIGAQTLLVPMVDTPEQAAHMVAATRYPPEGIRGVGAAVARASRWNGRSDYVHQANDEVCLLVQAETLTALDNLEAICAVDGVDGVFIGPADLAASMGYLGNPGHPDVQAAIDHAIQTIVASGKAAGTLTGSVDQAKRFLSLGATFVAVGLDISLLMQAVRQRSEEFDLSFDVSSEGNVY